MAEKIPVEVRLLDGSMLPTILHLPIGTIYIPIWSKKNDVNEAMYERDSKYYGVSKKPSKFIKLSDVSSQRKVAVYNLNTYATYDYAVGNLYFPAKVIKIKATDLNPKQLENLKVVLSNYRIDINAVLSATS